MKSNMCRVTRLHCRLVLICHRAHYYEVLEFQNTCYPYLSNLSSLIRWKWIASLPLNRPVLHTGFTSRQMSTYTFKTYVLSITALQNVDHRILRLLSCLIVSILTLQWSTVSGGLTSWIRSMADSQGALYHERSTIVLQIIIHQSIQIWKHCFRPILKLIVCLQDDCVTQGCPTICLGQKLDTPAKKL